MTDTQQKTSKAALEAAKSYLGYLPEADDKEPDIQALAAIIQAAMDVAYGHGYTDGMSEAIERGDVEAANGDRLAAALEKFLPFGLAEYDRLYPGEAYEKDGYEATDCRIARETLTAHRELRGEGR